MRLTFRIATSGEIWTILAPRRPDADELYRKVGDSDSDVELVVDKAHQYFSDQRFFTGSSKDCIPVYSIVINFLELYHNWQDSVVSKHATENENFVHRLERKCERNKVMYVRVDVKYTAVRNAIVFDISYANPDDLADHLARDRGFAEVCAGLLVGLRRRVEKTFANMSASSRNKGYFTVEYSPRTQELVDSYLKCEEEKATKEKRNKCQYRSATDFCTPIHPDCELYCNGKCKNL